MIPKIIHYCWFGKKKLPALAKKCIASWKKYCPDYELILWNEDNFDLNSNTYVREAYDAGKFAFVTDYVRLWVLYRYGGIYMDTDVEVIKSLDKFLVHPAFSGFETSDAVPTGIMASEQYGKWAESELKYYEHRHFLKEDGSTDTTTNTKIITEHLVESGFRFDNTYQEHKSVIVIYPQDYFCPKDWLTKKLVFFSENTHAIHHFSGSWIPFQEKYKTRIYLFLLKHLPFIVICVRKFKQLFSRFF